MRTNARSPMHNSLPRPASLRRSRRRGFTLVEMLTVIVIIGILVGLIAAAAIPVRNFVRNYRMKNEISQMGLALENCKTNMGLSDYPADFTDRVDASGSVGADLRRCLVRAFPRCPVANYLPPEKFPQSAAEALAFWLGGMWQETYRGGEVVQRRFIGFSADPLDPFDMVKLRSTQVAGRSRIGPFFEFNAERLLVVPGQDPLVFKDAVDSGLEHRVYTRVMVFPKNDKVPDLTMNRPYLYFKAQAGAYERPQTSTLPAWIAKWEDPLGSQIQVKAFLSSQGNGWINPTSYQLLCPGLDAMYAGKDAGGNVKYTTDDLPPRYPAGTNYGRGMFDDITNFSNGKLESDM